MKKPIFLKLFVSYLLLILAVSGIILAVVFHSFSSHATEASIEHIKKLGMSLQYLIKPLLQQKRLDDLNALVRRLDTDMQVRITVIDGLGVVLADSEHQPGLMENHGDRPEVKTALAGAMGSSIRYSTTLKHDMLFVALPMGTGEQSVSVLRMSIPLRSIDPLLDTAKRHTLEIAALIVLSSLVVALFFSHIISTPIRDLYKASKRIAGGDLKARVTLRGNDEIRELAESFNEMTEKIEISFSEVSNSKEEIESIVSSMDEGLLVIDSEGKIQLINTSAVSIVGSEKSLQRFYWEIIRSPRLNTLIDSAKQHSLRDEIELHEKIYLCSITPIRSGKAKIILLHDITQMKRLEKIKRDLAVNVSHELKTPLTAIKGFTETLMEESSGNGMEYLQIIKRHTDRLINIINDLLELSELEADAVRPAAEEVNIRSLIETVLTMFHQRIEAKSLKAAIEEIHQGIVIKGDPFRLEQLFINLIDNAVKYTEQGGITITIEKIKDYAVIKVADTGIGIPKEHLNRIFERFYVVDKSRSRKLGGTGLGLSIVKHIATLHKGTVAVSSMPYGGTTFTVTLPFA